MNTPAPSTTAPGGKVPTFYVEPRALAKLVRDHRKQPARHRVVSDDLARAFIRIAGGVWDRYRFTPGRDDFVMDVVTHLMERPLRRADPKRNLFSYFTTCAIRWGLNARDRAAVEKRRFVEYAQAVVDEGRPHLRRKGVPEDLDE